MDYMPPLVLGNKLEQYTSIKDSIDVKGLKIGGYIRISTKKDSQRTSVEFQKKYLSEWADINGYEIYDFYIDVKSGAYTHLRNDMKRMKNDVASGKIKGIVCKEISRTSRDIMDILELKRGLADKGAFFISIKENYDSREDDDEFLLIIHAGLAQKERKTTSSRVKITQMIKAREGKTNVASPAFGYMLSEDKQYLVIDPETGPVYRLIVDKYLDGWGQLKICKYLNAKGIKTKRGKKIWSTNSIKTIITNPVYLGISIYNVTTAVRDSTGKRKLMVRPREEWIIKENTHEPLITKEKFERIQAMVQERKERDTKEWSCTKKYLLSGFLYCDSCKGKLFGSKISKNSAKKIPKEERTNEDYYFYYADQHRNGPCSSKVQFYRMEEVDNKVMDIIKDFFVNRDVVVDKIRNKRYLYDVRLEKARVEREKEESKLDAVQIAIKRQQEAYENEVINLDEYKLRMAELREKRLFHQRKLQTLNVRLENVDSVEKQFNSIRDKVMGYIEKLNDLPYDIKEELVRKVFKKIYIKDNYTLKVEYTFEE